VTNQPQDPSDDDFKHAVETSTSLELPEGLSFEKWKRKGLELAAARRALQWKIGDWWIYGERRFGHRAYQVPDEFGVHYHTCENYAVVARAFIGSRRRESLSFGHHAEVAALPPEEADRLLDWCEEDAEANGRPRARRELRDKVKIARRPLLNTVEYRGLLLPRDMPSIRSEQGAPPRLIYPFGPRAQPAEPQAELDTSPAGGPVPEEMKALQLEPPAALDRRAIARAAIAEAGFENALAVFVEWLQGLTPEQFSEAHAAFAGRANRRRNEAPGRHRRRLLH
jgi:hypothetical protein